MTHVNKLSALLLLALGAVTSRAADVEPLLPLVPMSANAITVVRIGDIPARQRAELFGAGVVPAWVDLVVRASRVNPAAHDTEWSAALVSLPASVPFTSVAAREQAEVQDLAGHPAIRSPRGYVVELKPGVLGVMRTGSRQDAAFWAVQADRGAAAASGYLLDAARATSPFVLAYDTTNMIDPTGIRAQLADSESLLGDTAAQSALAALLPKLRGIRVELSFAEANQAVVRLDFNTPVGGEAPLIKSLFIEFLNDYGAAIPELAQAEVAAEPNAVVLRTALSDDSLRKIASLVGAPTAVTPGSADAPPPSTGTTTSPPPTAPPPYAASLEYYREVARLIHDLQGLMRSAKDYNKTATWHETYARRVDELPIAGVDPDLQQFGADTSKNFRALAASLRGIPIKINALNNSITTEIHVHSSYYQPYSGAKYGTFGYIPGPGELQTNAQQVRAAQAQAIAQGDDERGQIWQAIVDEQNRARIAMTQKYGVDFDQPAK